MQRSILSIAFERLRAVLPLNNGEGDCKSGSPKRGSRRWRWSYSLSRQISIITITNQRADRRRQMRSEYKPAPTDRRTDEHRAYEHRQRRITRLGASSAARVTAWLKFNDTRRPEFGIKANGMRSASNATNNSWPRTRRLSWITRSRRKVEKRLACFD